MDFDDLLLEAMRLLKSVAAVREYYNVDFNICWWMISGYEPSAVRVDAVHAGAGHNVCAVGDEDQSDLLVARGRHSHILRV